MRSKDEIKIEKIRKALKSTGFILEMKSAELLKKTWLRSKSKSIFLRP